MYLCDKGSVGMVFDNHVSDLFPEYWGSRRLIRFGGDRLRDFTPVAFTTQVFTFYAELVLKALDQACDLIAGLHYFLGGDRHPLVLPFLTLLDVVVGNFSSTITAWSLPTHNTGVFCGADNEGLLWDARLI